MNPELSSNPIEAGDPTEKKPFKDKRFKHNWRIDMLAVPKGHNEELEFFKMSKLEKHMFFEQKSKPDLQRKKSKKKLPLEQDEERMKRIKELSVTSPRIYLSQKKMYSNIFGKKFTKKMDDRMREAFNTKYYEYARAKKKFKKSKSKSRKSGKPTSAKSAKSQKGKDVKHKDKPLTKKKSKKELIAEAVEYCKKLATPKHIFKPPKINRGKIADLKAIQNDLSKMAKPKQDYSKRASQESPVLTLFGKVRPNALKYNISDRMRELAIAPESKRAEVVQKIPGQVQKPALKAIASPRIIELARKKEQAGTKEADFNEDAFKISPTALKYVATPRIKELAKAKEYN